MYFAVDMKSYYASVECVARGLDPLTARLLVADESRTDKTICLAVSPALKAIGVPSRPRLFEAKQAIALYEAQHRCKVDYIIAEPRMAEYIRTSAKIYEIAQRFVSPEDIHVYSVDEFFVDAGRYELMYGNAAAEAGVSVPHYIAMQIVREVLRVTGVTATVGIGTNLYLAKIGMDIVAKKAAPDNDGVRIATLDEETYRLQLWSHRPLTDFWQVGPGIARRLIAHGMRTMGDVATVSLSAPETLYKLFGINAELLIDHAWGIETATMEDIKAYKPQGHSLSTGQVLPRAYKHDEGFLVFKEMTDLLCSDLVAKNLTTDSMTWWIIFDPTTLDSITLKENELEEDFYHKIQPKAAHGTVRLRTRTNSKKEIMEALCVSFKTHVDPRFLIRRLGICACNTMRDIGGGQLDMFTSADELDKERELQRVMVQVRRRYGLNAIVRGMNLNKSGTTISRNESIGGHKAGATPLPQKQPDPKPVHPPLRTVDTS